MSIGGFGLTQRLASFSIETRFEDIPGAALESARALILDTLGVALLASTHEAGRLISAHAAELGAYCRTASIFGGAGLTAAPAFAAQANGTMANALDFDSGGHLPTHILPAVLAIAEENAIAGRETLAAFVLAYEGGARLTKSIDAKRK